MSYVWIKGDNKDNQPSKDPKAISSVIDLIADREYNDIAEVEQEVGKIK